MGQRHAVGEEGKNSHGRSVVSRSGKNPVVPSPVDVTRAQQDLMESGSLTRTYFRCEQFDRLSSVTMSEIEIIRRNAVRSDVSAVLFASLLQLVPMFVKRIDRFPNSVR